jgi:hypothetical protein
MNASTIFLRAVLTDRESGLYIGFALTHNETFFNGAAAQRGP